MSNLPHEIRRLRAERKFNQAQLARAVNVSKSLIASFESGRLVPQQETAAALDATFGSADHIQQLAEEARGDRRPWLRPWVEYERRATLLRDWQPLLIPGLLQIESYMRAVFATAQTSDTQAAIDDLVRKRLDRQATTLDRVPPVVLSCLIGESALRNGPRDILKDQLEHLVDIGHRSNVLIRIVPDNSGLHAGLSGPITLASLPDGRRVGHLDDQLRGREVSTPGDVNELELVLEAVDGLAMSVTQSRDLILRTINELD